ncbi:MAG: hypothetical protein QE271_06785 [Bacteriovoracaceae bacterium]|nr:hypothetical protein [Bacteriovoracaceae bacterium]
MLKTKAKQKIKLKYEVYNCPGNWMELDQLKSFYEELKVVASECLDEVPNYQCLREDLRDMNRLIISVARSRDGKIVGFCSSYIFNIYDELILHMGLTCVSPVARGLKLTHKLSSKVVTCFLLNYSLTKSSWISNVACVLSSLGNLANYFDQVYPSPFLQTPSIKHIELALFIDQNLREELYVRKEAKFNSKNFIFEESVLGNMFQKELTDKRYHHRSLLLNQFYRSLLNFERGDEVLQIGKVSWLTFPKYAFKKMTRKFSKKKLLESQELWGVAGQ